MRAVLCTALGPPEDLIVADLPEPVPGPGEALIRVTAAALNFMDTLVIRGRYQVKPALPFSPSAEMCGVVERLGPDTAGPLPGTRVIAYLGTGAAREKVVVRADRLAVVPDAVPDAVAASLHVAYGTTLHAYRQRARLAPGETIAVLGASGGVGQAAITLGKILGGRVIACAAAAKLDQCRALGADEVVDYETEDVKERLKVLTGGRGVDIVYDAVGDRFTEPAIRAHAWGGRLLVVGFAAGEIPKIAANLLLLKGADACGVFWGRFVEEEPERHRANTEELLALAASGRLTVAIDSLVPLEGAAAAIARLSERKVTGKIVVVP